MQKPKFVHLVGENRSFLEGLFSSKNQITLVPETVTNRFDAYFMQIDKLQDRWLYILSTWTRWISNCVITYYIVHNKKILPHQAIKQENEFQDLKEINAGVPQGSVLRSVTSIVEAVNSVVDTAVCWSLEQLQRNHTKPSKRH